MLSFPGYEMLQQLYDNEVVAVYRAKKSEDKNGKTVIIKFLQAELPTPEDIARIKHEYNLLMNFSIPGIIHPLALEKSQHRYAIILEDVNGITLKEYIRNNKLSIDKFFQFALELTDIVKAVHAAHIIHKDINPENIIVTQEDKIKLIDFNIATQLAKEELEVKNPEILEGSLPYISPEQTGRMNRSLDQRTDFYSLGVTFYEMLTGELPYKANDAIEWVHFHIAKEAPLVNKIRSDVPEQIARLIQKLMAKQAEDRYATAHGLKVDLEQSLRHWQTEGNIPEFTLGRYDQLTHFQIPQKLYGREKEIEILLSEFNRASEGRCELLIITGAAGLGKTSLVNEVHKPIVASHGYFTQGKFDQFQQDVPYQAFVQAFRYLIRQILTKKQNVVEEWRNDILRALGENVAVLTELIPELELLIGKQTPLPPMGSSLETQIRFESQLINLIQLFAKPDHPLVIFLDDMQWADLVTLNFLTKLMRDKETNNLLVIISYRDNDIKVNDALTDFIGQMKKVGITPIEIALQPLNLLNIENLLKDTLKTHNNLSALAKIILAKTAGNPFFVNTFLTYLNQEGLIKFSTKEGRWEWNIHTIETLNVTDNVVDLINVKINRFSAETRLAIEYAATIGLTFDLRILSKILRKKPNEVAKLLWPALEEYLLIPIGDGYKFAMIDPDFNDENQIIMYRFSHDRIHQAAYSLLEEKEKSKIHLDIGRLLLELNPEGEYQNIIFDIVYHYNRGIDLIEDRSEKVQLATLNNFAAVRAQESSSYQIALNHFNIAAMLLSEQGWRFEYKETFKANLGVVICEFLLGKYEDAEKQFKILDKNAKTLFDRATIALYKADASNAQGDYKKTINVALGGMKILGIGGLSKRPGILRLIIEGFKAFKKMKKISIDEIINAPESTEPDIRLMLSLIKRINIAGYVENIKLFLLIHFKLIQKIDVVGTNESRAGSMFSYGLLQQMLFRRYKVSDAYADAALGLIDKSNSYRDRAQAYLAMSALVWPWVKSFRQTYLFANKANQLAKKTGDLFLLNLTAGITRVIMWYAGTPLPDIRQHYKGLVDYLELSKNEELQTSYGLTKKAFTLLIDKYSDKELQIFIKETKASFAGSNNINKVSRSLFCIMVCYIYGKIDEVLPFARIAGTIVFKRMLRNLIVSVQVSTLISMTMVRAYRKAHWWQKLLYKIYLRKTIKNLKGWSSLNEENFKDKYLIVQAGEKLILNKLDEAMEFYEQGVAWARQYGYLDIEAYSHEMMADYFLQRQQYRNAKPYLQEARYAYQQWGANAKVAKLLEDYPELFEKRTSFITQATMGASIKGTLQYTSLSLTSSARASEILDLATVMKSAQAISSRVNLDDLLSTLIKILSENAGAQRGILLLAENQKLVVKIEYNANQDHIELIQNELAESYQKLSLDIVRYVQRTLEPVVLGDASKRGNFTDDPYIIENKTISILCLPIVNQGNLVGILYLENNLARDAFTPDRFEILRLLAAQAAISLENARLYSAYDQFVPHEFLDLLNKRSIVDIRLGDHVRKNMSVMFSDIRNFTHMSEKMTPDETFQFMNEYLGYMEPIIKKHGGFIDKYIGDAIMALFAVESDSVVSAAIELQYELNQFNIQRAKQNLVPVRVGVGVNSGSLMLGTLGGKDRLQTSVISDVVNVAARLEELTKDYDSRILITDAVYHSLVNPAKYPSRFISSAQIRGKTQKVNIWEVFAADEQEIKEKKLQILSNYNKGLAQFNEGNFAEALNYFDRCRKILPNDRVLQLYVELCQQRLG